MANLRFIYAILVMLAGGKYPVTYMKSVYKVRKSLRYQGIRTHRILDEEVVELEQALRLLSEYELHDVYTHLRFSGLLLDLHGMVDQNIFDLDGALDIVYNAAKEEAHNRLSHTSYNKEYLIGYMLHCRMGISSFFSDRGVKEMINKNHPAVMPTADDICRFRFLPSTIWSLATRRYDLHIQRETVDRIAYLSWIIVASDPHPESIASLQLLQDIFNELAIDELYDIYALSVFTQNCKSLTWEMAVDAALDQRLKNRTGLLTEGPLTDLRNALSKRAHIYSVWRYANHTATELVNRLLFEQVITPEHNVNAPS